jgi:DNA-binding IclR family transcriptional regulator
MGCRPMGKKASLFTTCPGLAIAKPKKAILAFLAVDHQEEIISRLEFKAKTSQTIVSQTALKREPAEIRGRGCARNDEELEKGSRAVAAPIISILFHFRFRAFRTL